MALREEKQVEKKTQERMNSCAKGKRHDREKERDHREEEGVHI